MHSCLKWGVKNILTTIVEAFMIHCLSCTTVFSKNLGLQLES